MNAQQEITDAQANWAREKKNPIPLYVPTVKSNLFRGRLSARAYHGYDGGDGHELDRDMKALHSSSALVVNFFDYWTCQTDLSPLLRAFGIESGKVKSVDFEAKFPTGTPRGRPAHLDVTITLNSDCVVAIESKFTEWTEEATHGKPGFRPAYFPKTVKRWEREGLLACQGFAQQLYATQASNGEKIPFKHLDAAQLLKHALGLSRRLGPKNFSLYYLYYDWPGEESDAHKEEIKHFADRVGEELRFKALTYQKVYKRLRASEQAEPEYLDYLGNRYFSGRGQG